VGDALVLRVHGGEVSMVPFALDGSASVEVDEEDQLVPQRLVKMDHGVLTVEDRRVHRTRYQIRTGATAPGRIIIRHAPRAGYSVPRLPPGTEAGEAA